MELPSLNDTYLLVGIIIAIVGQVRGWWESPGKRAQRERDKLIAEQNGEIHIAILGEPEKVDSSGTVIREKRPGLVALQRADSKRLAKVEEAVVGMNHLTGLFTEAMKRMDVQDSRLAEHDSAIAALIATTFDRGASAALEAERLKAANNGDTIEGEVD